MKCSICGAPATGQGADRYTKTSGGWCGGRTVRKTTYRCGECVAAAEYAQFQYQQELQAKMQARLEAELKPVQGNLFS